MVVVESQVEEFKLLRMYLQVPIRFDRIAQAGKVAC